MAHLGKTLNKSIYTIETKTLSAHIRGYRSAKLLGSVVLGTYLLFEDVLLTPLAFCAAFVAAGAFKLAKFILSIFKFIFCSKERTLENLAQILIAPISGLKIIIDFFGVAWVAMLLFIGNMLCFSPILARSTMGGINLYLRCTHTIPAVESNLTYLNKHIGRFNQ